MPTKKTLSSSMPWVHMLVSESCPRAPWFLEGSLETKAPKRDGRFLSPLLRSGEIMMSFVQTSAKIFGSMEPLLQVHILHTPVQVRGCFPFHYIDAGIRSVIGYILPTMKQSQRLKERKKERNDNIRNIETKSRHKRKHAIETTLQQITKPVQNH